MQFLKSKQQLRKLVRPYTGSSSNGVVYVEINKQYMVSRSIRKSSRNMQKDLVCVN
jgi:hypothetical protein